ncbi:MAG: isomerase [Candidatus Levybacteria bacterium RBG_16_35_11]|nr:MAG: isomerase [Candidatus Levybacteria bacterium RBG_16_35_11]
MKYFIHDKALVATKKIGENTRIWAFCNILKGAKIGKDCNICDHVFIENKVVIGNKVTVKCGVFLWDGITIEDNVFIGPNAAFANDKFPRSKKYLKKPVATLIKKGASLGANATVLPGIVVGENAMVGAGAVVTKDVPPNAIVVGNPARITGYVNTVDFKNIKTLQDTSFIKTRLPTKVKGADVYKLSKVSDIRGDLSFTEYKKEIPFLVKRVFMVYNVPSREVRGEHAHRKLHQFLICVKGSVNIVVDDGKNSLEIPLTPMDIGIHIKPRTWSVQYKYSQDAILLVFASEKYDAKDYIRSYDQFLKLVKNGK